jgi:ParB/RepB/Spo0J family partition protein
MSERNIAPELPFGDGPLKPREFRELPVNDIVPDPDQIRTFIDPDRFSELCRSIAVIGLLHPIGVHEIAPGTKRWMIIDGERRWRAAKFIGLETLPCRIYLTHSVTELRVLQTSENMHREELKLDEYAEAVRELVEGGMEPEVIAHVLARSEEWVKGALDIARTPDALALIHADRLSSVEAWQSYCALPPEAKKILLDSIDPISVGRCRKALAFIERQNAKKQTALFGPGGGPTKAGSATHGGDTPVEDVEGATGKNSSSDGEMTELGTECAEAAITGQCGKGIGSQAFETSKTEESSDFDSAAGDGAAPGSDPSFGSAGLASQTSQQPQEGRRLSEGPDPGHRGMAGPPCPHCGKGAHAAVCVDRPSDTWRVTCYVCGDMGPPGFGVQGAYVKWSERAPASADGRAPSAGAAA